MMDKLQRENLTFHLNRRLQLVESLAAEIEAIGITFRQLEAQDKRLAESFKGEIDFPKEMTPSGFREMFDRELDFQLQHGDPPRDSFLASVTQPRQDLTDQCRALHDQLLAGDFMKGE